MRRIDTYLPYDTNWLSTSLSFDSPLTRLLPFLPSRVITPQASIMDACRTAMEMHGLENFPANERKLRMKVPQSTEELAKVFLLTSLNSTFLTPFLFMSPSFLERHAWGDFFGRDRRDSGGENSNSQIFPLLTASILLVPLLLLSNTSSALI